MKGRYNITLSIDMYDRLNQFAYQTRISRSSIIENALNQYLSVRKNYLQSYTMMRSYI